MNKKILIIASSVVLFIIIVVLFSFTFVASITHQSGLSNTVKNTASTTPNVFADTTTLKIKDFKVGTGAAVKATSKITFDFVGMLTNGKVFSSTVSKGPVTLTLGVSPMIKGWQEGLIGMKVGGHRRLVIPPTLGYGATGIPGIVAPNATIIYDIVLNKIVK
jgi:FKBP-type peptidyl-prolyl cis-trans isomerase